MGSPKYFASATSDIVRDEMQAAPSALRRQLVNAGGWLAGLLARTLYVALLLPQLAVLFAWMLVCLPFWLVVKLGNGLLRWTGLTGFAAALALLLPFGWQLGVLRWYRDETALKRHALHNKWARLPGDAPGEETNKLQVRLDALDKRAEKIRAAISEA